MQSELSQQDASNEDRSRMVVQESVLETRLRHRFLAAAFRWGPLGGTAGGLTALPDCLRLATSDAISTGYSAAAFVLAGFVVLGAFIGVVIGFAEVVLDALPGRNDLWRSGLIAVIALAALVLVAPRLFSGARISRSALAPFGPYVLPPVGAIGSFVFARLLLAWRGWLRVSWTRRVAVVVVEFGAMYSLGSLHQLQVFRYYPALGLGLAVVAWSLMVHALAVAFPAQASPVGPLRLAATVMIAAIALVMIASPASNDVRVALARDPVGFSTFAPMWMRSHEPPPLPIPENGRRFDELGGYGVAAAPDRDLRRANVIFVVIDTVRADRWSSERASQFPALTDVRARCASFTRAFSHAPSTGPSLSAILQGRASRTPSRSSPMLEMFRRADYRLGVVAPPVVLRLVGERSPLDAIHDRMVVASHEDESAWGGGIARRTGTEIADTALRWLNEHAHDKQPVFLWVQFFSAHQWMLLSPRGTAVERYDSALRDDDDGLARLLAGVRDSGMSDDTIVVVASDHGESLGAHSWETHSTWLFPELVHVPLAFCIPGVSPREIDTPVGLASIAATLADSIGLDAELPAEGASLLPLITGPRRREAGAPRPILLVSREQTGVIFEDRLLRFTASTSAIESLGLSAALAGDEDNLATSEPERTAELLSWIGVSSTR